MKLSSWLATIFFIALLFISPSLFAEEKVIQGLSDDELLETISRQSFEFFQRERNPHSGLVKDRAKNFGEGSATAQASIAATGFALTVYPVAVERGWMDYSTAYEITRRTLQFFLKVADQEHGFFYHFLDPETGKRSGRSELSPIDTALFLAGALFAAEYFDKEELHDLAQQIYERVDFAWMLNNGKTLALSWSPETGFNRRRWDHYDESMILYLLAIGSPTYPIPASSWDAIARPVGSYKGYRLIQSPPLFTHQYSHIWIDFRDKHDAYADYFKNSVNASLANRAFAMDESVRFTTYGPNAWGLTASDGPLGYRAYGAPPGWSNHDGTLAPTGCGSSIVFTPEESIACLRHFYEDLGDKIWGRYGFSDAFNLDKQWFDSDVIGIDQGALILMIENYRSGLIWDVMSRNPDLQKAMKDVGFQPGTKEVSWPEPPVYEAVQLPAPLDIDGHLKEWPHAKVLKLDQSFKEFGNIDDDKDLSAEIRLAWDKDGLYFFVKIRDQDLVLKRTGNKIWQDDLFEIYVDPQGDGLLWNNSDDFQIGFRPGEEDSLVETWTWFGHDENPSEQRGVIARSYIDQTGYVIEGGIQWSYLGIKPQAGSEIRIGLAVHDVDRDRTEGKIHWFFRSEEKPLRFVLGKVVLKPSLE